MNIDRLSDKYPDIKNIKRRCKKKVPSFVWDYFDSATGHELSAKRNRTALDEILFKTSILRGNISPTLKVSFLERNYDFPIGIAPVGMSGLIYPKAEIILARHALEKNYPYVLSTVGASSIEQVASSINNTKNLWFQLYTPRDEDLLKDILKRCINAGIDTLVVTIDLPGPSVRERQIASGLTIPPSMNTNIFFQCSMRPFWSIRRLFHGIPKLETLSKYSIEANSPSKSTNHIGYQMRGNPDESYLKKVRKLWPGKLIIKGLLYPEHLDKIKNLDLDALWVSNHAGRQFDACIDSISALKNIRENTDLPLILDSGLETGLDVLRAYSLGADYTMMGRSWHYSLGGFGKVGPELVYAVLTRDLKANMYQIGIEEISEFTINQIL